MAFVIPSSFISRLRILITAVALIIGAGALTTSCGDNDFNDLPREIQQFISQYFPGQGVADFSESGGTYTVNLDNSASLVFNSSLIWTTIDGNGSPIPRQLVFDQFPSKLYDYIETTENLGEVYSVTRDTGIYMVIFHGYIISYNVSTGDIQPVVTGSGAKG